MPKYYNQSNPSDLRDLDQSLINMWSQTGNPKLNEWILAPAQPDGATWGNGEWVVAPSPAFTAEAWLDNQGYTALRLLTCLDLEGKLRAVGATSAKLAATRQWIDGITLAAAMNPDATASNWPPAPFAFDTVVQEAIQTLS